RARSFPGMRPAHSRVRRIEDRPSRRSVMAATVGLPEAAAALDDHFGTRLDADQDEGRRLMAEALCDRFGISQRAARKLVDRLEQARTIRYVTHTPSKESATGVAYSG